MNERGRTVVLKKDVQLHVQTYRCPLPMTYVRLIVNMSLTTRQISARCQCQVIPRFGKLVRTCRCTPVVARKRHSYLVPKQTTNFSSMLPAAPEIRKAVHKCARCKYIPPVVCVKSIASRSLATYKPHKKHPAIPEIRKRGTHMRIYHGHEQMYPMLDFCKTHS